MTITAGSRLGPYEIVSRLGAGGMGEVWKARDTRLDRSVAIKVLSRDLSASPEIRQRFERDFVSGDGDLSVTPAEVNAGRLDLGETRILFAANFYLGPRVGLIGYAVRPDGKGLLANSAGDVGAPRVALVENWDAALSK